MLTELNNAKNDGHYTFWAHLGYPRKEIGFGGQMSHLNLRASGLIASVVAIAFSGGAAFAQMGKSSIFLHITNHRKVALVELHATAVGDSAARTLAKGLAAGSTAVVKLKRGKFCIFELHATYQDGSFTDFAHFDLCMDETLNLVD